MNSVCPRQSIAIAFLLGIVSLGARAVAAEPTGTTSTKNSQTGAKALFVDSFSGAELSTTTTSTRSSGASRAHVRASTEGSRFIAGSTAPRATGLMYWIELVTPSGEVQRVTTDRTFHSGERIRLHIRGNVDGDVAVYQQSAEGRAVPLFPDLRVNGGSALVLKGATTVVPSDTAWFRFDDQTGTEHLTVVLTPRQANREVQRSAALTAERSYEDLRPNDGSKGLVLETDKTSAEPATYVVRPVGQSHSPEPVSVEIQLRHEK